METINGYENYEIDIWGNVWNKKYKKFMKPHLRNGYLHVILYKDGKPRHFSVHRLIALHFIENPHNYPVVDHIDRNTLNNDIDNLRWVSLSQNNRNKDCKGYYWNKRSKKWMARYQLNKKLIYIGLFDTEDEARNAYLNAIKDL